MTSAIGLPDESATVRCSDFARRHGIDPGGTGLAPDVIVLVEVPEPWPKPVARHPELHDMVREVTAHPENVRLLAAVPHEPLRPRVISLRRTSTGVIRTEQVMGADPARDLRAVLAAGGTEMRVGVTPGRVVLICTQGSHDVCCGSHGNELADRAEADLEGVEVFRVSHTGGHRFAPTAMTLPDGRMWAYLTPDLLTGVLEHTIPAAVAAETCRGWWGARGAAAQVGERAVFVEHGWPLDARERTVSTGPGTAGGVLVTVDVTGSATWVVSVEPGRDVPSIACEAPGGLPVKPGTEWVVTGMEQR